MNFSAPKGRAGIPIVKGTRSDISSLRRLERGKRRGTVPAAAALARFAELRKRVSFVTA